VGSRGTDRFQSAAPERYHGPMAEPDPRLRATTVLSVARRAVTVRVRELQVEVASGPSAGAVSEMVERELAIGSDPSNHLVVADPTVSRFHCRVRADERGFRLVDRGSANGTRVNGVRVRDAYLEPDARIELGDSVLVARFGAGERDIELSDEDRFGPAIGRSVVMRELFARARRAAATDSSVLLSGETGTGKDVLARAIHQHSRRAERPFAVFDCGAVAPSLVESALFGHVRGAFTGADSERPGVFEQANGGTLFIDELGELELALQPKLLRALDTGSVTRVGSDQPVQVDVRVIAATHRDLPAEVEAGRFRADLYFRLAVIPLEVPALRERREDIPLLVAHFARHVLKREPSALAGHLDEAFGRLQSHPWPGNVRELRNVVERALVMADADELGKSGLAGLVELRDTVGQSMRQRLSLKDARENFDREYLRDALEAAGGDTRAAAETAGIHYKSFERLLRRYGIER